MLSFSKISQSDPAVKLGVAGLAFGSLAGYGVRRNPMALVALIAKLTPVASAVITSVAILAAMRWHQHLGARGALDEHRAVGRGRELLNRTTVTHCVEAGLMLAIGATGAGRNLSSNQCAWMAVLADLSLALTATRLAASTLCLVPTRAQTWAGKDEYYRGWQERFKRYNLKPDFGGTQLSTGRTYIDALRMWIRQGTNIFTKIIIGCHDSSRSPRLLHCVAVAASDGPCQELRNFVRDDWTWFTQCLLVSVDRRYAYSIAERLCFLDFICEKAKQDEELKSILLNKRALLTAIAEPDEDQQRILKLLNTLPSD